jgi:phosphate starvation-inducible protein PhoH
MSKDKSAKIPQGPKVKETFEIKSPFEFTEKQKQLIDIILDKKTKVVFINAPAGTGKTFIALYAGLKLLQEKKVAKISYVRTAVEASKSIGFLPGELNDKINPYTRPLADKLDEFLYKATTDKLLKDGYVTADLVNFLRGASINVEYLFVDECFPADESVVTEIGAKSIDYLYNQFKKGKKLPLVQTYNETEKKFEYKPIVKIWSNGEKEVLTVKAGNRKIRCTPNHLFLTNNGWEMAKNLKSGDMLIANNVDSHQVLRGLNEDQKQVILGSYLGDGSITTHGDNRFRLRIIHGIKQQDYCSWKASMFGVQIKDIEKNGFSQKPAVKFSTKCFSLKEGLFNSGIKTECPDWVLEKLDWRGIAIWYMDDGSFQSNTAQIYTCSFNDETQAKFVNKFKSLGIECKIKECYSKSRGKSYKNLVFNVENTTKLLEKIAPYLHENLLYKTNISQLNHVTYKWDNSYLPFNYIVCDGIIENGETEEVFDLEIKDNHNFVIGPSSRGTNKCQSGPIVHNCQNFNKAELVTTLTRLGKYSKFIFAGDTMQSDIGNRSGFAEMFNLFNDDESKTHGIYTFNFDKNDILRSEELKYIIDKLQRPSAMFPDKV